MVLVLNNAKQCCVAFRRCRIDSIPMDASWFEIGGHWKKELCV